MGGNEKKYKKMKIKMSLRKKVIVLLLAISIIPLFILGQISISKFLTTYNKQFYDNSITLAKTSNEILNTKLQSNLEMIDNLSEKYSFDESSEFKSTFEKVAENFGESYSDLAAIYFYGAKSKEFYQWPKTDMPDEDYTQKQWYKEAVESNGKDVLSDVYKDAATGESIITISKAIIKNNQVKGVLAVDFSLSDFAKAVSSIKYGSKGFISIVDNNGMIVAHTIKENAGKSLNIKADILSKIKNQKEGFFEKISIDNINYRVNFTTSDLTKFKVIVGMPVSEFNGTRNIYCIIVGITIIIILVIVIILGYIFSKWISKNINIVRNGIKKAASGNFKERIYLETGDEFEELSQSYNEMLDSVSGLISTVDDSINSVNKTAGSLLETSKDVSTAIGEIAGTVTEISKGSVETSSNLDMATKDLNEVSEKINDINKSVEEVNVAIESSNSLSNKGIVVVKDMINKSDLTKKSTTSVRDVVLDVRESVGKIEAINKTITEITGQINLLALNANIEAARAGEAGKGFAVVADEVRKLAEQTAKSASDISRIIEEIQNGVYKTVTEVNNSNKVVDEQLSSVYDSGKIFEEILKSVKDVENKVAHITIGVEEVTNMKNGVLSQVENLLAICEETAAGTEETSASSEEVAASADEFVLYAEKLKSLSDKLREEISAFKYK